MDKRFLIAIFLMLFCPLTYADTCPTINAIKHNALKGWVAYDTDDDKPLSTKRIAQFKTKVTQFVLAEWIADGKQKGAIHCYYRDINGSSLEAYLAKTNYIPRQSNPYWYQVSGFMHCAAGTDKCLFQTNGAPKTQLAKNNKTPV